jgi:hypothetical protein
MQTKTTEQHRSIDSPYICVILHTVRAPRFHLDIISVSPT